MFEFEDLIEDGFRNRCSERVRHAARTADEGRDLINAIRWKAVETGLIDGWIRSESALATR